MTAPQFCPACGTARVQGARFCGGCGAGFEVFELTGSAATSPFLVVTSPSRRPMTTVLVAAIVILVLLAGFYHLRPAPAGEEVTYSEDSLDADDATVGGEPAAGDEQAGAAEFEGWATDQYSELAGTYRVAIASNECQYELRLIAMEPSGPGGLVWRATAEWTLVDGQVLDLPASFYDVQQTSPTFLCNWVVRLVPE